jgi:hypothetical protein
MNNAYLLLGRLGLALLFLVTGLAAQRAATPGGAL